MKYQKVQRSCRSLSMFHKTRRKYWAVHSPCLFHRTRLTLCAVYTCQITDSKSALVRNQILNSRRVVIYNYQALVIKKSGTVQRRFILTTAHAPELNTHDIHAQESEWVKIGSQLRYSHILAVCYGPLCVSDAVNN